MLIMVADQDIEQRRRLAAYIEKLQHTPQEMLTARDVLDKCREKCPHLIFVDKELSGTPGIEVIRQIRQLGGHAVWVPIVYMGKKFQEDEIRQAIEAGSDDYLEKPIPELRIFAKISSAARQQNLKEDVFNVAHSLVVANRALESLVTQDTLTGIGNSNSFDQDLEKAWFQAKDAKTPLTLIMANIDYFQAYNQVYGANRGDEVIIKVADALKRALPGNKASISRLTGDVFAILVPECNLEKANQVAEKLREAIEALNIPHINSGCSDHVTISLGVSAAEGVYTTPLELREAADFALFQAKHRGRNRVFASPLLKVEKEKT